MEGFVVQPAALALAGLDRLGELAGSLLQWISPEWACMADLLRLSGIKSGDRLLDAGCGTGDLLAMAAGLEAGAMLVGLDPDEDSLELASHKIPSTLHPVELHQGVAEAMPFEDGAFDLVTATNLFGGLEPRTRARALDECFRVLRPGGRLLLTVPAYPWLWSRHDETHHHFRRYTKTALKQALREAGLQPVALSYFNTLLFPLIAGLRLARKLLRLPEPDDTAMPGSATNALLMKIFSLESAVIGRMALPFGVSLMAVARRA